MFQCKMTLHINFKDVISTNLFLKICDLFKRNYFKNNFFSYNKNKYFTLVL